jgi:hypothetical protein
MLVNVETSDMATYTVSNQAQLDAAVRNLRDGDVLLLRSGTYNSLNLDAARQDGRHLTFDREVVIASANPNDPAVIRSLNLNAARNIEFRDIEFDYGRNDRNGHDFRINNATNIEITRADFEGQVVSGLGVGTGIRISNSTNIDITNSEFSDHYNSIFAWNTRDLTVTGNRFGGQSNDAMQMGGIFGAVISGNNFGPSNLGWDSGHKDLIQFWTGSGQRPSENITIRDNNFTNDESTHGIFMGNILARNGDRSAFYRNITIEDNNFRINHAHGVTIEHVNGARIEDNTIDQFFNGRTPLPLINVSNSSIYVTIRGNDVASVPSAKHSTWVVSGNDGGVNVRQHWEGADATRIVSSGNVQRSSATTLADVEVASQPADPVETVRIDGRRIDGVATIDINGLDFDGGDELVFINFDRATFRDQGGGNIVNNSSDGTYVRIDDVIDLQELVAFSPAVTATTQSDTLILRVAQADGDVARVVLNGLGDEFRAADQPDLF